MRRFEKRCMKVCSGVAQGQIFIVLSPAFQLKSVNWSLHIVKVNRNGPPILAGSSPLILSDSRRYCSFSLLVPFQHAQRYFRLRWSRWQHVSTFIKCVWTSSLQVTTATSFSSIHWPWRLIWWLTVEHCSCRRRLFSFLLPTVFWYRLGAKFEVFAFLWCCHLFHHHPQNIGFIHAYFWAVDKPHCYYDFLHLSGIDALEHWPAALSHCGHYLTVWTWTLSGITLNAKMCSFSADIHARISLWTGASSSRRRPEFSRWTRLQRATR